MGGKKRGGGWAPSKSATEMYQMYQNQCKQGYHWAFSDLCHYMWLNVTVTKTVNCFILHSLDTTEGERGDICPPPFPCIRQCMSKCGVSWQDGKPMRDVGHLLCTQKSCFYMQWTRNIIMFRDIFDYFSNFVFQEEKWIETCTDLVCILQGMLILTLQS